MKTPPIQSKRQGFSLIEMSVVIVVGLMIAGAGLTLMNQQTKFLNVLAEQDFILTEAPQINRAITSIIGRCDAIRLHETFDDAINDQNAVTTGANVLVAAFTNPDGSQFFGLIVLETINGNLMLNYYQYDPGSALPVEGTPSWTISREIDAASFALVDGLFQVNLTGPNAENLTYTISPSQ